MCGKLIYDSHRSSCDHPEIRHTNSDDSRNCGSNVGIIAGVQQLFSAFRRRKFKRAEDKLLEAIEADDKIKDARAQVEQYNELRIACGMK